jgi:fatty-acyl-CoA synthase
LRLRGRVDITPTFKHDKQKLVHEGYDPGVTADTIYFDDRLQGAFVRLDQSLYDRIAAGKVRL